MATEEDRNERDRQNKNRQKEEPEIKGDFYRCGKCGRMHARGESCPLDG